MSRAAAERRAAASAHREALAEGERLGARYRLAAWNRPPAGHAGLRLGARTGSSLEFQDYREYEPGDDLRRVDWGAFARSDRLVVKRYRDEVYPHLDVLLDASRSMSFDGGEKAGAALLLAALFATAAAASGYSRAIFLAGDACAPVRNPADAPTAWDGLAFDGTCGLPEAVRRVPPRLRPRGARVVVSDLLWPEEPDPFLALLAHGASTLLVVEVLSRDDLAPQVEGPLRLVDAETGELAEALLDERAVDRYRRALEGHREAWRRAARRVGARLVGLAAEDVLSGGALRELVANEVLAPR